MVSNTCACAHIHTWVKSHRLFQRWNISYFETRHHELSECAGDKSASKEKMSDMSDVY